MGGDFLEDLDEELAAIEEDLNISSLPKLKLRRQNAFMHSF